MLKLLSNLLLLVSLLSALPLQAMSPEDIQARQERLRELQEQNKLLGTKRTQSDLDEGNEKNPSKKPKLEDGNNQEGNVYQAEVDHAEDENTEALTIQPAGPNDFCGFAGLPTELIHQIAGNLDLKNFRSFKSTCKYLGSSLNDEMVLRDILINKIRSRGYDQEITEPLCSYFLECMQTEHYITLKDHQSYVLSIIQLSNGNLASCSNDGTIKIWDLKNYQCIKTLERRNGRFHSIIELHNGNLACCSDDETIKIWDLKTGKSISTLKEHEKLIRSIIQLSNGNLASCSDDGTIKIWDLETGKCISTLKEDEICVYSIIELHNGNIASCSDDGTIKIWNLENGQRISTLKEHKNEVWEIAQLRNGDLASCSRDKTIKIWDLENGQCIKNIPSLNIPHLHKEGIAYFSDSDENFCALNLNAGKYTLELESVNELQFYEGVTPLRNGVHISHDSDGSIHIFHPNMLRHVKISEYHTDYINSVIQLNNGDLASCSDDETIKIWTLYPQNLSAQQIYLVLNLHKNRERHQTVKLDEFWSAVFDSLPDYLKDQYQEVIGKTD